jgi:hypothetical protein
MVTTIKMLWIKLIDESIQRADLTLHRDFKIIAI